MPGKGKDITDPAYGDQEIRGGESPESWQGPLPAREEITDAPAPDVATPPATAVTIAPGEPKSE
jgi:hypothetical protein